MQAFQIITLDQLQNLGVKHIRAGGSSTINMDNDFEADTLSTTGAAEANLGHHDFGDFDDDYLQNLGVRHIRAGGSSTINMDNDFEADTLTTGG